MSAIARFDSVVLAYRQAGSVLFGPIDLILHAAEIVAIVGPNGSGKSTFIKSLFSEVQIVSGTASLFDLPFEAALSSGRIAYIPQDPIVCADLEVTEAIAYGMWHQRSAFRRITDKQSERLHMCMTQMGVGRLAGRSLGTLSIGERQRVLLTRALVQSPALLVLDEPTNHLDPATKKQFWLALCQAKQEHGLAAWVVTHDLDKAQKYSDRTVAFSERLLTADASSSEFWSGSLPERIFGDFR